MHAERITGITLLLIFSLDGDRHVCRSFHWPTGRQSIQDLPHHPGAQHIPDDIIHSVFDCAFAGVYNTQ